MSMRDDEQKIFMSTFASLDIEAFASKFTKNIYAEFENLVHI